jgi:DNA-binding IclR family transcriptional regulator
MDIYTGNTISSIDAFLTQLVEIRKTEVAQDAEELVYGLRGIATPIRDHTGTVIASLSTGGSSDRLRGEKLAAFTQALTAGALDISRQLGYFRASPD